MAAPAGLVIALGLCFVVVAVGAVRLARAARRRLATLPLRSALSLGDGGAVVVVESMFTLLVLFLVTLVMLQLCLAFAAFQVVNLAAYRAARSAVVVVPQECDGEKPNELAPDGRSGKRATLRRAAALTTVAISPRFLDEVATRYGSEAISWFAAESAALGLSEGLGFLGGVTEMPERYYYAIDGTAVWIEGKEGAATVGQEELLEVAVSYRFWLRIPVAARLLGNDRLYCGPFPIGYCTEITCRCTIRNEGYPTAEPRLSRPPDEVRAVACGDADGGNPPDVGRGSRR